MSALLVVAFEPTSVGSFVTGGDHDIARHNRLVSGLDGPAGRSGLGLGAQRAAVAAYLDGADRQIIEEVTEVESGRLSARPQLDKALAAARLHRCSLVVSKVGRLTRSVAFLSRLLKAGVDVRFADLLQIEGAKERFLLQRMIAVAELEAGMISAPTSARPISQQRSVNCGSRAPDPCGR